ncbi:NF038122 family metalloprotease [Glacieibacterium frigidum]|uniref:PEP-CTERM protein-sorting domain-containing protein n=1 Tax=Glacieibacterium frigidum TaxID=2593303 RepID=A0A552UGC3_9SPHN|nr:NF038122 family metalloprotease [Glacieibacterium frigidum]TRW17270.1 hypothetical protein FMM06_03535 [Glacieibacterium frigidum]
MNIRLLCTTAMLVGMASAAPASALTITLRDNGAAIDEQAARGFRAAALYWESVITNDVNVNFDISFGPLGPNIIGGTGSSYDERTFVSVRNQLNAGATSTIDTVATNNLPTGAGLSMITPGYRAGAGTGNGINNNTKAWDTPTNNANGFNNRNLYFTTANGKALGYDYDPNAADAEVTFSSDFAFDFDPRDGISANTIDFIGVAIHEFGHALGFVSGVDDYDYLGTGGPAATANCGSAASPIQCRNLPAQQFSWGSVLDLYRYSNDPTNIAPGTGPVLDWSTGTNSYFSINGGATNLAGFSTGSYNGDGWQASHWKSNNTCANFIGIMNPYACDGEMDSITALDLAAFDAIGWNINFNVAQNQGYNFSTAQVAVLAGIPEPASWALMIGGFGMVGSSLRARRRVATAA